MKKTIGIFAHVDAGKTTFSEQLLFHTDMIRTVGRVDHKNTLLDTHDIEKKRGITIFSDQAYFKYKEDDYYLIDTPGHVDFSAEMERSIGIIDYAVVIISAIDGIQSHTETVYELLEKANKPILFFINKVDASHADVSQVLTELDHTFGNCVYFDQKLPYEALAEYSEVLMEAFFEERFDETLYISEAKREVKNCQLRPVLSGSALKDTGIDYFLEMLHQLTETCYPKETLSGMVYKIKYDNKLRQTFIKLNSGVLSVRDMLGEEKVTEIRRYFGTKYETVQTVYAGDVCAVIGVQNLKVGDTFGTEETISFEMHPTLKTKVDFDKSMNPKDVFRDMKILEEEDPSLLVEYSSKKEITLGIMGTIQLEILEEVIPERFGYQVTFEDPKIIYKETIKNTVLGCGHFEPLKHYAEVILKLEPNQNGDGITFESKCSTDDLHIGHQNLVKHHVFEKVHRGILTGSEITDIKVTLTTGRGHNKHTSGGDFREATIRALRQGLEQAENVLLEPIYQAIIKIPFTDMGKVMTDITKLHGTAEPPIQEGEFVVIKAFVPVATFKDYNIRLSNITSGRGRLRLKVIGYDVCHNPDEVIEMIAYDKITDDEYPSSSIFCTKGKGYTVLWDVAKDHMHCIK